MRRLAAIAVVIASASACSVTGVSYRQDDRVSFTAPEDRATVTLPVTVRWRYEDFDGSFAVFVDRSPMPPGRSIEWFGDRIEDIYETSEPEIVIDRVPARTDDRRERHEVTVVLLDDDGRRIAETGWSVEFEVERP